MMNFNQKSTWRGLALIGSAVALLSGNGHLFSAELTDTGVSLGGVIGSAAAVVVPIGVGLWETLRDELKTG